MKVLVTGATGFIGTWLVRRLVNEHHDVRVLKRATSHLEELEGLPVEFVNGDVTHAESLVEACRGIDSVFHCAGLIAYTRTQRKNLELINVQGTANIINACVQTGVRRLVHLSSVAAVGSSFDGKYPLTESSPFNLSRLNLGYFESKRASEQLVIAAAKSGELDAVILNPSNVYGRGDAKKGSRSVQLKVARGKFPFYTSGGVSITYIDDVIDAILVAWKSGKTGERYILSGENVTIKQLFHLIAAEVGIEPPKLYLPNAIVHTIGAVGEVMERFGKKPPLNSETAWTTTLFHWYDSSKAQRELGLKVKPAKHAIHESLAWIKEHGLLTKDL